MENIRDYVRRQRAIAETALTVIQSPSAAFALLGVAECYILQNRVFGGYALRTFEPKALSDDGIPVATAVVNWLLDQGMIAEADEFASIDRLFILTAEGRRRARCGGGSAC